MSFKSYLCASNPNNSISAKWNFDFDFLLVQLLVQFQESEKKSCALIRKTFSSRKGDDNLLRKMQYIYREEALRELLLHFFDKLISNTALGFISLFCVGNEISHIIPWK